MMASHSSFTMLNSPIWAAFLSEKMTKQLLHDMGKTLTEFQKKYFFRASGGLPPDPEWLKDAMAVVDRKPIPNKG